MGEPDSYSSSNPVFIVIMRNSRGKLFVYVAVLFVLCFIVFLLNSTHTSLKELEAINEKCQQQRDSLSAQLQVVYEHKNRLEKSLQQEKTDHKHTKEANEKQASELENKFQKEKDDRHKLETQISQLKTSYSELEEEKIQSENALKQQLKTIQSQKDTEIQKLQTHISDLLSEKDKLEQSVNTISWKLEQCASEVSLCNLQLKQTKAEVQTIAQQLRTKLVSKTPANAKEAETVLKIDEQVPPLEKKVLPEKNALPLENPVLPVENEVIPQENQLAKETKDTAFNLTASPPTKEKSLDKPRVMPPSNHMGDGVLPKPSYPKTEDANKDLDAAIETIDSKRYEKPADDHLMNNIIDRYADVKANLMTDEKKINVPDEPAQNNFIPAQNANYPQLKDQENHPQVAPPNFDNVEEKDDHAAERGEDGNQYIPDAKPQVEEPVLNKQKLQPKQFPLPVQENNDIAAQLNDMMNKSPGNINNAGEQNVLGVPPHFDDNKNQEFKNEAPFMHRGADGHRGMDDKNYEEDDDDRDNDDEPQNGLAPVMKGAMNNVLQDNDFDDQENQDNIDNAKEEEGVVVAPK